MTEHPELNPTRTWCLGRYLIDLPASARLFIGYDDDYEIPTPIGTEYGKNPLTTFKYMDATVILPPEEMTLEAFKASLETRQEELRKAKNPEGGSRLSQVMHPSEDTYILATWGEEAWDYMEYIEGYRWINGFQFMLKEKVGKVDTNDIEKMQKRLERLRSRAHDELPAEEGFCFPGGIFVGEKEHREEIVVTFIFPEHLDVDLMVETFPNAIHGEPLLDRRFGLLAYLGADAWKMKTLRAADKPLIEMPGQELLMSFPDKRGDGRTHFFRWEFQGNASGQDFPYLVLELNSGRSSRPSSLNDEEAITLWDAILNSFRLRPVKPGGMSSAEDFPRQVASGDTCPQSGDWKCLEDGRVIAFQSGQTMPPAHYDQPVSGFWNRISGKKQTEGPGHWAWVEKTSDTKEQG